MQNFFAFLIVLPIFTWYSTFGVLNANYTILQKDVENIVYKYTQVAAKKGVLYESVFDEMCRELDKYGTYEVYLEAEKFEGSSDDPQELTGWSVVEADLREQGYDIINIQVVYTKKHPISVMYEYSVFGSPNGKQYDFRLIGKSSCYVN